MKKKKRKREIRGMIGNCPAQSNLNNPLHYANEQIEGSYCKVIYLLCGVQSVTLSSGDGTAEKFMMLHKLLGVA